MKTLLATLVCISLTTLSLAEQPKEPPDPVIVALKAKLEHEFQKLNLNPKPTFEFLRGYEGRTLVVRLKTREYVIHPRTPKGGFAETTVKREGPADDGFLLNAHIQPLGQVNQPVTPQVIREPYWSLFVDVYPVKNTQKQIYFFLAFNESTDGALIENIKKIASQLNPIEKN